MDDRKDSVSTAATDSKADALKEYIEREKHAYEPLSWAARKDKI